MPIFNTIGSAAARAYGLFRRATGPILSGSYLYLWGSNAGSQIGNYTVGGTLADRSSPVQITNKQFSTVGLNNVRGGLAITTSGQLWAWGSGTSGILGDGTTVTKSYPVQIGADTDWTQVAAGSQSFAIKSDASLWAWGVGTTGALGTGTTASRSSPVMMGGNVRQVARSGGNFNACVTYSNELFTWGLNNLGQLGDSTTVNKSAPTLIGGTTNWSKVACGMSHMVALKTDGTVWAWGSGANYRTGQGTSTNRSSPVQIGTLTNWTDVDATYAGSFLLNSSGEMYFIGVNGQGQAGMGGTDISTIGTGRISSPVQILFPNYAALPPTSGQFSSGILSDGTLWSWGNASSGQLGDGTLTDQSFPVQVGTLTTWSKLSGYSGGMSAIKTDGTLWGWGINNAGQIGNSTTGAAASPEKVGTLTNWANVYTGAVNTYSIKTDGTLWAWGQNFSGQIGDGTTTSRSSPVQIGTLTNWARVNQFGSTAYGNAYAVKTDGTLWAWGNNSSGIFGDSSTVSTSSPVQVGTLTNWSKIASDCFSTLAVKTDGTLWSWGVNNVGQLGDGTTASPGSPTSSPVQVGTLTNWADVRIGGVSQVVALKTDGTMWGWGSQYYTFDGSTLSGSSPVQLGTEDGWAEVCMGYNLQWARKTTGELFVWGSNSGGYQAGAITTNITTLRKSNNITWSSFTAGNHSNSLAVVAKKSDGTIWAWGSNASGTFGTGSTIATQGWPQQVRTSGFSVVTTGYNGIATINSATNNLFISGNSVTLGQGSPTGYSSPQMVGSGTQKWYKVNTMPSGVMAVDNQGGLWGWGYNNTGQLGNGSTNNESAPVQVGTLTAWRDVSTGLQKSNANVAVKSDGTLWGWGIYLGNGNGSGTNSNNGFATPMPTSGKQVADFSCAGDSGSSYGSSGTRRYMLVLDTAGRLWGIGDNTNGQLGNNSTVAQSRSYAQVGTLTNWLQVSASGSSGSDNFAMAVKTDGTLWGWGYNGTGALGVNNTTNYSSPVQVGTLTDWATVSAGNQFTLATKTDGTLWGWGLNANYQLGQGDVTSRSSPVQIGTLTTWASVEAAEQDGMAIKTDGTLWGWGRNDNAALGDGTTLSKSSPIQIGTLTNWSKVRATSTSAGFAAIKTDGTLWNWGYSGLGRIGDGADVTRSSPVQIGTLTNWVDCMTSKYNSYFLNSAGGLYSTGTNYAPSDATQAYWLGVSTAIDKLSSPVQIGSYTTYNKLGRGLAGSGAIDSQGYLFAWGPVGQSYSLTDEALSSPVQIGTQTNWSKPFIRTDGSLWLWGAAINGNMGLGADAVSNASFSVPVRVGTLTNWSDVRFGSSSTVAVKTDGTAWSWGGNSRGELGLGNTADRSSPVQIGTLTTWSKLKAGDRHTIALKTDGTVWCWGLNSSGQLGQGNTTDRSSPVQVSLATTAVDIAVMANASMAILSDGTAYAWGVNGGGQLGDGTTVNKSTPVAISGSYTWVSGQNNASGTFAGGLSST